MLRPDFSLLRKNVGADSCLVVRDDGIGHSKRPFAKQAAAGILRSILRDRGVEEAQIAVGSVIIAGVEYSAAVVGGSVTRYGAILDGENAFVKHASSQAGRVF